MDDGQLTMDDWSTNTVGGDYVLLLYGRADGTEQLTMDN